MPTRAEDATEYAPKPARTLTCPRPGNIPGHLELWRQTELGFSPGSAWTTLFTSLSPSVFI